MVFPWLSIPLPSTSTKEKRKKSVESAYFSKVSPIASSCSRASSSAKVPNSFLSRTISLFSPPLITRLEIRRFWFALRFILPIICTRKKPERDSAIRKIPAADASMAYDFFFSPVPSFNLCTS